MTEFMNFTHDGAPATGDSTPMTDAMWAKVRLTVDGEKKKLFGRQKPEGVDVEVDSDGKADVWKIFAKAYPDLKKTSGRRPVMTTRDVAVVHNFIHKELSRVSFVNPSRHVRLSLAHYEVGESHDEPRDAFARMVMGKDAHSKFAKDPERWTPTAKTSPGTPRHRTRSATKAAAKDDDGDDDDDDEPVNIEDMKELASAEQLASVLDHIVDNATTYGAVDKDPYMRKIAVLGEVKKIADEKIAVFYMGRIGELDERILNDTKAIDDATRDIAARDTTIAALKTDHAAALAAARKAAPVTAPDAASAMALANAKRDLEAEKKSRDEVVRQNGALGYKNGELEKRVKSLEDGLAAATARAMSLQAKFDAIEKRGSGVSTKRGLDDQGDQDAPKRPKTDHEAKERAADAQKRAAAEAAAEAQKRATEAAEAKARADAEAKPRADAATEAASTTAPAPTPTPTAPRAD